MNCTQIQTLMDPFRLAIQPAHQASRSARQPGPSYSSVKPHSYLVDLAQPNRPFVAFSACTVGVGSPVQVPTALAVPCSPSSSYRCSTHLSVTVDMHVEIIHMCGSAEESVNEPAAEPCSLPRGVKLKQGLIFLIKKTEQGLILVVR